MFPSRRSHPLVRALVVLAALVVPGGAAVAAAQPTVTIDQASTQVDPTSVSPILFTVVFSAPVTGFVTGDVALSGTAMATTAAVTPLTSTTYRVSVSGMSQTGTVIVAVPAGRALDGANIPNLASTSIDDVVTFTLPVNLPPTVTINQSPSQVDPTSGTPIVFSVAFSEPVTGFTSADVALSGTALPTTAVITGTGPAYTVSVSGMSQSGTVLASIPAGRVVDSGGAPNSASSSVDNQVTFTGLNTVQPPTNLQAWSIVGNSVVLRWDAPAAGPAPTGYALEAGVAPGTTAVALPLGPLPVFTVTAPTGVFFVRVRSTGAGGSSAASNEIPLIVNVPAAPSAPDRLRGVAIGDTVELSWRNTFGGGAPTALALDVSGPVSGTLNLGVTETFTFTGVPAGLYTFRVRAVNAAGASVASAPAVLNFPGVCGAAPPPPTGVLAFAQAGVVTVLWDPPATGSPTLSYALVVSGAFSGTFGVGSVRSLSAPAAPGTYTLQVVSANACGASAPSTAVAVTVP